MKNLKIKKNISLSFLRSGKSLNKNDFENIPNSLTPGEWIFAETPNNVKYIGFINTRTEMETICYLIKIAEKIDSEFSDHDEFARSIISSKLQKAISFRKSVYNDGEDYRLIFGFNDGLPGLIADKYSNQILLQFTTAGLDRYRDYFVKELESSYKLKVIIIDKKNSRQKEFLPTYDNQIDVDEVNVCESGLKYCLPISMIQKNGFYFDHRENRVKLENFIGRYHGPVDYGLDLFCYTGSWGMHLLRSKVKNVVFVDQGDYSSLIQNTITDSQLKGEHTFVRDDVFSYLDNMKSKNKKFDIIVSDPPAFSKSSKKLKNAITGYRKLYKKIFPILNNKSLLVVASCTHGVSLEDLSSIIRETADFYNKSCSLLDVGTQGFDHHVSGLDSKGYYLKYLLYVLEDY